MCDCGCNTCETKKAVMLNESIAPKEILSEGLKYHMDNNMPLTEHVYRAGSQKYFDLWAEARALYSRNILDVDGDDLEVLTETDLGHYGMFEGKKVPLDFPIEITEAELNDFPFEYKGFKYNVESTEGMVNDRGQKVWQVSIQNREGDVETTTVRGSSDREGHQEAKDFIDDELLPYYGLDEDLDKKPNFADFEYRVALLFKPGEKTEEEIRNYARVPFRKAIDAWEAGRPWKHFLPKTLSDFISMWNNQFRNVNINENRIIIKTKGKRLAIDKKDLQSLKSGKDIVGYSTKYPGQEEWVLARDKWEIEGPLNESKWKDLWDEHLKWAEENKTSKRKDANYPSPSKQNANIFSLSTKYGFDPVKIKKLTKQWEKINDKTYGLVPSYEDWMDDKLNTSLNESKKSTKKLNKPMRSSSGGKAYKVYVRDPKTKKVKTVRFGSGGLRAKINDPKARQAFAKRHKCSTKKDKTKASYWSCRLPRYAKLLGLKSSFSGFW
jgi:hypothetical protein